MLEISDVLFDTRENRGQHLSDDGEIPNINGTNVLETFNNTLSSAPAYNGDGFCNGREEITTGEEILSNNVTGEVNSLPPGEVTVRRNNSDENSADGVDNRNSVLSEQGASRNDSDYNASGESELSSARNSVGSSDLEQIHSRLQDLIEHSVSRNRSYSSEEVCSRLGMGLFYFLANLSYYYLIWCMLNLNSTVLYSVASSLRSSSICVCNFIVYILRYIYITEIALEFALCFTCLYLIYILFKISPQV